jgi:hypothetical protein
MPIRDLLGRLDQAMSSNDIERAGVHPTSDWLTDRWADGRRQLSKCGLS